MIPDFPTFFKALWPGKEPFPWQTMLAERGATGKWPEAISLPTASGKTAALDTAIHSLALQASLPPDRRTAPRRIWFVVDRRIVVDEAHERARKIATQLAEATSGPLKAVADALRSLSGNPRPLAVARLRGGVRRDDAWALDPAQPAILCSTVDQVGSSLLFRSYGHGNLSASIWAGLAANDSLILLDEAHCAVPFLQTLRAIAAFRSPKWAEEPVASPFACTIFSATLPPSATHEIDPARRFPLPAEQTAALDHPALHARRSAPKPASLHVAPRTKKDDDPRANLPELIVKRVRHHLGARPGQPRLAVMVNRVATAEKVARRLRDDSTVGERAAEVVLLTGRLRPPERDALVASPSLSALASASESAPPRPIILVTTQCLEVGADFSFDDLVTECASLDALRQRFGRLDRLGRLCTATASIVIIERDTKEPNPDDEDPIYGRSIYETWQWLQSLRPNEPGAATTVDFGISAMDAHVDALLAGTDGPGRFASLLAPAPDAPVLLPAHLDLLCQTAPQPALEPDVSLFLHGKERNSAEVRVVWRADLPEQLDQPGQADLAGELLSLLPPTTAETVSVPLHRLRTRLVSGQSLDDADVEGGRAPEPNESPARTAFLIWSGGSPLRVSHDPRDIRPGDTVILPASFGLTGLAQAVSAPQGLGPDKLDLAEAAALSARPRAILRLHASLWTGWAGFAPLDTLISTANATEFDREELLAAWQDFRQALADPGADTPFLPDWLKKVADEIGDSIPRSRLARIASAGDSEPASPPHVVLFGPIRRTPSEDDFVSDASSALVDDRITLVQHSADMEAAARQFASHCLPPALQAAPVLAAPLHDLGKLDRRFQALLHGSEFTLASGSPPLAKSPALPLRKRQRALLDDDLRLPSGFRHEMVSLQLAEHLGLNDPSGNLADLILHLIASHHGHARPFAPVVDDREPTDIDLAPVGSASIWTAQERIQAPMPHRLDSGVSQRFWRLTRRHGWWGLAYLETIFRLADWHASRNPGQTKAAPARLVPPPRPRPASSTRHELLLPALDGANPLGFLAALGVLRATNVSRPDFLPAMSWTLHAGTMVPRLQTLVPIDQDSLIQILASRLAIEGVFPSAILKNPEWQKLKVSVRELRIQLCQLPPDAASRISFDCWAALFGETAPKDAVSLKTRFDFHSGQQKIVESATLLRKSLTPATLHHTLFSGWKYVDQPSLRWDPLDEKRLYAFHAINPSNTGRNPIFTDVGANLLALEALSLFPLIPDRHGSQAGFSPRARYAESWQWPLWSEPVMQDEVGSLLHQHQIRERFNWLRLFRCRMGESGKGYRTFSPAKPIP